MIWWYLNHSWKRLNAFQLAHGSQPQAFLNPPQKKEEGGIGDSPKDHHDFLLSIFFLFFFGGNWRFVWNFQVIHSFFVLFYVGFQALANKVVGRRPFFFGSETFIHLWWITFGFLTFPDALKPCCGASWPEGACHQPDTEQKISSPNLQAGHILVSVGGLHLPSLGKWWAQDALIWRGWGTWLVPGGSKWPSSGCETMWKQLVCTGKTMEKSNLSWLFVKAFF